MSKPSDAAKKLIGDFSPKLVELTDRVLFDDVWERKELSKRDRSLITVAALIALNRPDQLKFHLVRAVENGVKNEELIEAITHLAFYAGWPSAITAVMLAKELFEKAK
jgi:4-carboxymuconolactone decarboxylase